MTESPLIELTGLLNRGMAGDAAARDRAFGLVYGELRRCAASQLAGQRELTLSPTALVNEMFVKLAAASDLTLNDRGHFFALAARAMRQLVIDQRRHRATARQGGDLSRVALEEDLVALGADELDYLDLDRALSALEHIDPRAAQVVEMHVFAGLNFMEIAQALGLSDKTVRRDWSSALAFLKLHSTP